MPQSAQAPISPTKYDGRPSNSGVPYRKTIYEGYDDESAIGARAGLFLQQSRNLYLRMGLVGIKYRDCNNLNSNYSELYPEISAGLYF